MNTTSVLGWMFCLDMQRDKGKVLSGENNDIKQRLSCSRVFLIFKELRTTAQINLVALLLPP